MTEELDEVESEDEDDEEEEEELPYPSLPFGLKLPGL